MSRPLMQIAFQHSVGWDLRYLIGRVTGRPVHVATIYDGVLYEASFSDGFRAVDAATRLADGQWEVMTVPTRYDSAAAHALAVSRLGMKYDWWGAMAAWWLGRVAGAGIRDRLFCSEASTDELLVAGVPLLYRRSARYTPRKLADECRWKLV